MYDASLKRKWDNKAVMDYAVSEARKEGEEMERAKAYAGKLESAIEFKKMGVPVADIAKGLQLPIEEVEKL